MLGEPGASWGHFVGAAKMAAGGNLTFDGPARARFFGVEDATAHAPLGVRDRSFAT